MSSPYRPDMTGFAGRLGLTNGIEELMARPVPTQEIFYYREDDLTLPEPADLRTERKTGRPKRRRSARWR